MCRIVRVLSAHKHLQGYDRKCSLFYKHGVPTIQCASGHPTLWCNMSPSRLAAWLGERSLLRPRSLSSSVGRFTASCQNSQLRRTITDHVSSGGGHRALFPAGAIADVQYKTNRSILLCQRRPEQCLPYPTGCNPRPARPRRIFPASITSAALVSQFPYGPKTFPLAGILLLSPFRTRITPLSCLVYGGGIIPPLHELGRRMRFLTPIGIRL